MSRPKCCHCGKKTDLPRPLEYNVECYGGGSFNVKCSNEKCGRVIKVLAERKVKIEAETFPASDESYTNWNQ